MTETLGRGIDVAVGLRARSGCGSWSVEEIAIAPEDEQDRDVVIEAFGGVSQTVAARCEGVAAVSNAA